MTFTEAPRQPPGERAPRRHGEASGRRLGWPRWGAALGMALLLELAWTALLRPLTANRLPEAMPLGFAWSLVFALVCVHVRYLCRAFPLRAGQIGKALWVQLQAGLLVTLAWAWGASRLLGYWSHAGFTNFQVLWSISLGFYILSVAITYTMEAWLSAQAAQHAAAAAQLEAREAELRALRAQVNPHFLFNSLHSISALAGSDPARARQMCLHLSKLYRLTLGLALRDIIPLRDELAVLRAYVAVESVRFGARLRYREEIAEAALEMALPALLLQPLVENAMKHGIAGLAAPGELTLRASLAGGRLRLELANDFDPEAPRPQPSGHGLENIRRRIAACYGASGGPPARLELETRQQRFIARLDLPAQTAEFIAADAAPATMAVS